MRAIAIAAALAAAGAGAPAPAHDAEGAEGAVTVVLVLDVAEGSAPRAAAAAVEPIRAYVRTRPGLLDEAMLRGTVETSEDFLHVTRWEALEDWEAMFADQAFLDILSGIDPQFDASAAEVYLPLP